MYPEARTIHNIAIILPLHRLRCRILPMLRRIAQHNRNARASEQLSNAPKVRKRGERGGISLTFIDRPPPIGMVRCGVSHVEAR
jgi:hypothetical protein